AAEEWGQKLKEQPGAIFADHLLDLEACQETDRSAATLKQVESLAKSNAGTAAELIAWMNRHDLATEAIAWSRELNPTVADTQPVPMAVSESFSCRRDWPGLRDFVAEKNWGNLESLRLAVASHAARRLNNSATPSMESQAMWHSALKSAQVHSDQLAVVARLSEGWGYGDQAEEAWWAIANGDDNPKAALNALQQLYKEKRDTYGLLRVAKRAHELNPDDLIAANNSASLALLVKNDAMAHRVAEKLYLEHPRNAACAVTYAFALHTEGKTGEGLKIMGRLRADQLHIPAVAAYYVVMLVENGEVERARQFLNAAKKATLLPEEERLLVSATKRLI
ncbi:MAG: hypothetical protein JWO45_531, partial [Spartobacteria bacterium]|nr:hypothetical protein [Spartobacteria bacterium]